jgi:hypothetical protein
MDMVLDVMRALMATTPQRWIDMAETLPVELLVTPPAAGEWSPMQCLQHLVDSEAVYQFRVQAFLDGRDFQNFDPETQGTRPGEQTPLALAEQFATMRAETLRLLEKLSPADLARKARHSELGMVTMAEMFHNWAGHDLNHTVQAERALMQPFIQGCGPWKKYYTDHLIGD